MSFFELLSRLAKEIVSSYGAESGFLYSVQKLKVNKPGVYLLILNGDIKKAGSAQIGIQKRMQQYYGLNNHCGLNEHINETNRDKIKVKYQYCEPQDCEELESKLNDKYEKSNSMEWSERRPRSRRNTVILKI